MYDSMKRKASASAGRVKGKPERKRRTAAKKRKMVPHPKDASKVSGALPPKAL
jgi:hypothetical protein